MNQPGLEVIPENRQVEKPMEEWNSVRIRVAVAVVAEPADLGMGREEIVENRGAGADVAENENRAVDAHRVDSTTRLSFAPPE